MTMKSSIWCVCVIGMLFIPTVAFSEIVTVGNWQSQGNAGGNRKCSYVWAYADGDTPDDYGVGQGWESTYTTEAGSFNWAYYTYAYGEGTLTMWDNQQCAFQAQGYAHASCDSSSDEWGPATSTAYVALVDSGYYGEKHSDWDGGGDGISVAYSGGFEANQGVDAQHSAFCQAVVYEDSTDLADANANAQAWTYMSEE